MIHSANDLSFFFYDVEESLQHNVDNDRKG